MSRNKERVGAVEQIDPVPQPVIPEGTLQTQSGFNTPTEIVDLPSAGKFYPPEHILHKCSTIEIKYMTATEEDLLTSKSLIRKGLAVDRMLQSIMVDPKINLNDLLLGDKNALIVAARITGYGSDYTVKIKCPVCDTSQEVSFDLNEIKSNQGSCDGFQAKYLNDKLAFEIILPTGTKLLCKMMTGIDEHNLAGLQQARQKQKLLEALLTDQMKTYILAVNDNYDRDYIASYVSSMPAMNSRHLRRAYIKIVPNIDMSQHMTCSNPECEEVSEVVVPFTTEFFWPK